MDEIGKRVIEMIKEVADMGEWETITPECTLKDGLGMDGLDILDVSLTVENEFNISIHDDEADNWKTVEDIINSIKKKKGILS